MIRCHSFEFSLSFFSRYGRNKETDMYVNCQTASSPYSFEAGIVICCAIKIT